MLLSRTYRPPPSLAAFVRRFYVFEAELPGNLVIEDFLLAETAFIRCLLQGNWQGEVTPGVWSQPGRTLLFGANERPFRVRVQGSFLVVGAAIRPSGWRGLFTQSHRDFTDRMLRLEDVWGDLADSMCAKVEDARDDAAKVAAMSAALERRLDQVGTRHVDPQMAMFEVIARTDSAMRVEDAADRVGLSVRQLERRCLGTFGLSPKAILRRSRYLDMATAMRGFSSPTQQDLAALRYFDQSHVTREFKRFTGMTPHCFERAPTPLHTAGLKLREESRFED